jgi:hypothetical protein
MMAVPQLRMPEKSAIFLHPEILSAFGNIAREEPSQNLAETFPNR